MVRRHLDVNMVSIARDIQIRGIKEKETHEGRETESKKAAPWKVN